MKVEDLFTLHQGNGFELMNMQPSDASNINFVSRTAQNNGVVAQVEHDGIVSPFPAGCITVALGGSVLSSFVQVLPFYTAFHVMVLKPIVQMTLQEKLFYCMCIQANAFRYNYGRQANKTLRELELPDQIPEWVSTTQINPVRTAITHNGRHPLQTDSWTEFRLGSLFRFVKGKRLTRDEMNDGNTNYLGAIADNNGVSQKIDSAPIFKANCITVNYNGSVGESFYQSEPFWATDDVNVLYAKGWTLNQYIALFRAC